MGAIARREKRMLRSHDGWLKRPLLPVLLQQAATDMKHTQLLYSFFNAKGYWEECLHNLEIGLAVYADLYKVNDKAIIRFSN